MYKKILVAIDGSESAERGVETAAELARTFDAELLLVHVYGPVPHLSGSLVPYEKRVETHIIETSRWLEEIRLQLEEKGVLRSDYLVLQGSPAHTIRKAAIEHEAELLVVGSRGLTGLKGLLLGSVSEYLVGASPCPVLVVR